jgi:type IV pilus assembly protein PilC
MPTFKYKALKKGETESYESTVEAKDRFEVYGIVRKDDAQVLSVEEVTTTHAALSGDILKVFRRIKDTDRILLTRNLGAMLNAGLSLSRALDVIERQTKNPKLKDVVKGMSSEIESGGSLSSAMLKYPQVFPNIVTSMVAAGEEAGTLSESLTIVSLQLERAYDLKKKVKGAMIYPSVIVSVLLLVGVMMMIFIVPTLTETFREMEIDLPMSTRVIIGLSDFLVEYTFMAFLILAAVIAGGIATMRTERGKRGFESIFLRIPMLGTLMRETNSARTGRTLASLLRSGVNMLSSIEITKDVLQNHHYKDVLVRAHKEVQGGKALASVFVAAEDVYPPLVGELIAVGEETGALPDMLLEVATFYEKAVEQKTKNMSTIIEPFLMLIVGGAVGFFAVSMISPIYNITSTIQ